MKLGGTLLLVWLLIGVLAAYQRDYFSGGVDNCNKAASIAATVVIGPLNYVGFNPKVSCHVKVPQPSK